MIVIKNVANSLMSAILREKHQELALKMEEEITVVRIGHYRSIQKKLEIWKRKKGKSEENKNEEKR